MLIEIKEIFTGSASAALFLLVYWWVHVNQDQAVVKHLHHLLWVKRKPALRTLWAFIFDTAALADLVFDRSEPESHQVNPSSAKSGK
jgi:hypothetical protein